MKLRLSWILPLVQLPSAIFLLEWGEHSARSADVIRMRYDTLYAATPTLICGGINAPAKLLAATSRLFGRVDHEPPAIFGITLDYVFFLIGVVILWYVVGQALEDRQSAHDWRPVWTTTKLLLAGGPLALMGSLFFYLSLQGFLSPERWNNLIGGVLQNILILLWSMVLLGVPSLKLVQRLSVPPTL